MLSSGSAFQDFVQCVDATDALTKIYLDLSDTEYSRPFAVISEAENGAFLTPGSNAIAYRGDFSLWLERDLTEDEYLNLSDSILAFDDEASDIIEELIEDSYLPGGIVINGVTSDGPTELVEQDAESEDPTIRYYLACRYLISCGLDTN